MIPYVAVAEFKQAPTAIDISTLDQTAIGNQQAQDSALLNVLKRASAWVDNICRMDTLSATLTTETKEVRLTRGGRINVHVGMTPIVNLQTVKYRLNPSVGYSTVDNTLIQTYESWFSVYAINPYNLTNTLMMQMPAFSYFAQSQRDMMLDVPITVQYTYVSGYFNSQVVGAVTIGANTITVVDATGLVIGSTFTIYDGATEESCKVLSITGNTITLTAPTLFAHADKAPASALPEAVKQAVILLASYLIKERGSMALTVTGESVGSASGSYSKAEDIQTAKSILQPYIRVVSS